MIEKLKLSIRKEMNQLADDVATGAAGSFDQYRHYVGRIEALALVERMILDMERELLDDDIDDGS